MKDSSSINPSIATDYADMFERKSENSVENQKVFEHSELKKPSESTSYDDMEQIWQPTFNEPPWPDLKWDYPGTETTTRKWTTVTTIPGRTIHWKFKPVTTIPGRTIAWQKPIIQTIPGTETQTQTGGGTLPKKKPPGGKVPKVTLPIRTIIHWPPGDEPKNPHDPDPTTPDYYCWTDGCYVAGKCTDVPYYCNFTPIRGEQDSPKPDFNYKVTVKPGLARICVPVYCKDTISIRVYGEKCVKGTVFNVNLCTGNGIVWVAGYNLYGWLGTGQNYTEISTPNPPTQFTYDSFDTVYSTNPIVFDFYSSYSWTGPFTVYYPDSSEGFDAWEIIPGAHPGSVSYEGHTYTFDHFQQTYTTSLWLDPPGTENRRQLMYYKVVYYYYEEQPPTMSIVWPTITARRLTCLPNKNWTWQSHANQVSFILNSEGGMYCCGSNERGALGIGEAMGEENVTGYSLPNYYTTVFRQVAGLWKIVITNDNHTYALQADGSLWHTGRYGNSERNTFTNISGDNWETLVFDTGTNYFLVVKKVITTYYVYAILADNSLYFYETLTSAQYDTLIESYNPAGGIGDENMWIVPA